MITKGEKLERFPSRFQLKPNADSVFPSTSSLTERERERGEVLCENSWTEMVVFKIWKDGFPVDGGRVGRWWDTRGSMLREREERNVSFMLIPAGAALRLTTMLSLLISPADVVVTSCWYTCRPNLVAQGLRLSGIYGET